MNPSLYRQAQYEGDKASGAIVIDGREVGHTKRCPHCHAHFVSIKGSGIRRHFCPVCKEVTCGQQECAIHFRAEDKLTTMEARAHDDRAALEAMQRAYPHLPIIST